ncbi:MAG: M42 family metallopeptidase [Chloroflexota bacterium]
MFELKEHLRSLVDAHAPSGHEAPVRAIVREAWQPLVNDFEQDKLGSLIGIKRATQPLDKLRKIMLAAHMDEIGLMVRDIVEGFIFVHRISGVDNRVMLAQPVVVQGKRPLRGVVAATPPHLMTAEERKSYPSFNQMVIDVGLPADEVNDLVRIGDLITPDTPMIDLQGSLVAGKAMDDRACVAIVTFALHELQMMQHSWDVYAAATVQEESGLLGARTAAYHIQPDIAIALDVGFAEQPGVSSTDATKMGEGPAVALGANIHPKLFDKIIAVAKQYEIKHQIEPVPAATGTDAWAIQVARDGIPTALLSLPIRNMHSPVETADLNDLKRTGRLLAHFIASLDADFMSAIDYNTTPEKETTDVGV